MADDGDDLPLETLAAFRSAVGEFGRFGLEDRRVFLQEGPTEAIEHARLAVSRCHAATHRSDRWDTQDHAE